MATCGRISAAFAGHWCGQELLGNSLAWGDCFVRVVLRLSEAPESTASVGTRLGALARLWEELPTLLAANSPTLFLTGVNV